MTTGVNQTSAPPEAAAAQQVMQLATAHIAAAALNVVLELRIADHLTGPRSASELARAVAVQEDGLYRVMRVLASLGIVIESSPRVFEPTLATRLMRSDEPGSLYGIARFMCDPKHFLVYAELMESVRTGRPAVEKVFGAPTFDVFARDPDWRTRFNDAMTSFSAQLIPSCLEAYDFGPFGVLVDVAGGHGEVLLQTLRRYPHMRGVLFDLHHVVDGAKPRFAAAGLQDRVEFVAGDFFAEVPRGGDAYLMKHIIHDWDDERAKTILGNIHRALAGNRNGRVILLESVIRPGNDPDLGKLIDIEMLVFPGGRERTADEFAGLFAATRFELARVVPTTSPLSVIEARPT